MEVKEGYKLTEIGIIPKDWELITIGDISEVDSDNLPSSTNSNYVFKYISLEDVDNGILKNISELVFRNAPSRARRIIKKGDILVSTVRPNLKSHLLISEDVSNWICSTGFSVLRCNRNVDSNFVFNHFFASIINIQINSLITGSNYPAINRNDVMALQIPLPPLPEQQAIAEVLTDTDNLIQALEKQIAKKKLIKQGVMQQLLTPKEGWEVKKLGEIVVKVIDNRGKTPPFSSNEKIELIETTSISFVPRHPDFKLITKYVSKSTYNNWFRAHPQKGDILVSTVGEYSGSSAILIGDKGTIAQNLVGIRISNDISENYVFYWTRSNNFRTQLDKVMMNQAQPSLKVPWLLNFKITIPSTSEQKNIVSVLSSIDSEMESLLIKLSKYKQLKQGLMQQLLTGKIRLIES